MNYHDHDLDRAAVTELRNLVAIYLEKLQLDEAAKVLFVVEQLDRRINGNVVQMSGWEPTNAHPERECGTGTN